MQRHTVMRENRLVARVAIVWISIVWISNLAIAQDRSPIRLLIAGTPVAQAQRGIELGVAEMAQTAKLLKRDVQVVTAPASGDAIDGVIAGAGGRTLKREIPQLHLGPLPKDAGPCSFTLATPAKAQEVTWHPALDRYGASELNERFVKRYRSGMTADAYAGWIAVKALVEAALRPAATGDKCAALGRLRFDGHKGRPLTFDPVSRALQQPLYLLDGDGVAEVKR